MSDDFVGREHMERAEAEPRTEIAAAREQQASSEKGRADAKAIEARRACAPVIDCVEALRASLTGGNHGTAATYGADRLPAPMRPERLLATIQRVAAERETKTRRINLPGGLNGH